MIMVFGIRSSNVYRLRAALIMKGLQFQHVSVNLAKRSKEFDDLTAVGKIPVIEDDDGTIVYDSKNIVDYLDHKHPKTYRMIPEEPKPRAMVLNAIALVDRISEFLSPLYVEKFNLEETMRKNKLAHRALKYDAQQKEDMQNEVSTRLGRLKEMYHGKTFLTGNFSFADASVLAFLKNLEFWGFDIADWKEWMDTVLQDHKIASMFPAETEKGIKEI